MDPLPNAFAFALPSEPYLPYRSPRPDHGAVCETVEERWPIGLSFVFVVGSSILLWLPIIAGLRWLLGYA